MATITGQCLSFLWLWVICDAAKNITSRIFSKLCNLRRFFTSATCKVLNQSVYRCMKDSFSQGRLIKFPHLFLYAAFMLRLTWKWALQFQWRDIGNSGLYNVSTINDKEKEKESATQISFLSTAPSPLSDVGAAAVMTQCNTSFLTETL